MKKSIDPKHLDFGDLDNYDSSVAEAIEGLESVDKSDFEDVEEGVSQMNYWLADIYDYCDIHRIWTRK